MNQYPPSLGQSGAQAALVSTLIIGVGLVGSLYLGAWLIGREMQK